MTNFLTLCLLAFGACSATEKKYDSPPGYDFNKPEIHTMPADLTEISGIAFYPGRRDRMYAIQDEEGKLFAWDNGKPETMQHLRFGKHGDYEDVAITTSQVIVLESNGTLHIFPYATAQGNTDVQATEWKGLVPEGEYESLYANNETQEIYIVCKQCKADKNTNAASGYVLQLDAQGIPSLKNHFSIPISGPAKGKSGKLAPLKLSAITFNQLTGEWYLLSGVNNLLIIADKEWKAKQTISLNPSLFTQAEGIAIDIDNNLYISNEAGSAAAGTVLKFVHKKP